MNWVGIKNGELLKLIDTANFDVFLTGDKNMENQQKVLGRSFAILVLSAINWTVIRDHIPTIEAALGQVEPGTCTTVECGHFVPARFRPTPDDSSAESG